MSDAEAALPVQLGRYRPVALLGRGAMGVVYKAHDPALDRDVAIKLIRTDLLNNAEARAEYRDRFRREAHAAARCAHPNIVAVYDFADADEAPFIVLELLVALETLDRRIARQGALGPSEAVEITLQILDGLGHAHGLGIVHRDVKPANINLVDRGHVKIGDFGVARLDETALTMDGVLIGTPSFMSPEQVRGLPVDHRTDLFSTGLILFEMLSGRRAFPGRGATEVMYKIVNEPPAGLETPEGVPGVPPAVQRVLRRALAKQPADRFPTARDFATALQAAFLGTGGAHRRPVEDDDRTVVRAPAAPAEAPQRLLRRAQMVPRAPRPGTLGGSRGAAASISAPLAAPPAATGRQRSPAWDTNFLRSVEGDLATYVGPIARVLVRKAAEEASDVGVLYRSLAANIQDAGHRQQFLRRALHDDGTTRLAGGSATRLNAAVGTRSRLTPEALHSAERALTFFVGPIAKVLVRRIAQETASPAEFYARIQDYLPRDEEKAAFRREVRRDWDPLVR